MKDLTVFQPTQIKDDYDGMPVIVFPDILFGAVVAIPVNTEFDLIGIWVHEFTEISIYAIITYETQYMEKAMITFESIDGKEKLTPHLWHLLASLSSITYRKPFNKEIEKISAKDYLKGFKTNL